MNQKAPHQPDRESDPRARRSELSAPDEPPDVDGYPDYVGKGCRPSQMSIHVAQLVQLGALNDSCKAAIPTCEAGFAKNRHPTCPQRNYQSQSPVPDCQLGDCNTDACFTTWPVRPPN